MGLYNERILPRIIDIVCGTETMTRQRQRVIPQARGQVLELGIGTGLNLAQYADSRVERLFGVDPCETSLAMAAGRAAASGLNVDLRRGSAEDLPFPDDSMDSVVSTYSLCTIPNPEKALAEVRRVLKPGGQFLFCEHVASPRPTIGAWQNRLNRVWGCCFGGCNINRDVARMVCDAGLDMVELANEDVPGELLFIRHQSVGRAVKANAAAAAAA